MMFKLSVNDAWFCEKFRYYYAALFHKTRLDWLVLSTYFPKLFHPKIFPKKFWESTLS